MSLQSHNHKIICIIKYESLLGLLKLAHAESWSWMGIFCQPKSFSCYFKFQRKTSILSCQAVVTSVVLCGNFSSRKNMKTFSCKVLPFISWLCKIRYSRLWERNLSFSFLAAKTALEATFLFSTSNQKLNNSAPHFQWARLIKSRWREWRVSRN